MASIFITAEDLIILTGAKTKSKQIAMLRKNGIPFWLDACERPIVAVASVIATDGKSKVSTAEPNFEALRKK